MLLFFNVENFKSFSQKTTLHLTPTHSALFLEHVHQVGKGGGRSILGAAVISGANASGKTNLVSALLDSRDYIVKGVLQDSPIPCAVPFALDPAKRSEGSRFEYTFSIDDNLYFYGFVVRASAVCEEWLFEIDGKETKRIFERELHEGVVSFKFNDELTQKYSPKQAEAVISDKILFLTAVASKDKTLSPLYRWFENQIEIAPIDNRSDGIEFAEFLVHDKEFKEFLDTLLRTLDTGISVIDVMNIVERGVTRYYPGAVYPSSDENKVVFDIRMESEGIRQLLNLSPFLYRAKQSDVVLVIDELDRSLHPLVTRMFIELFYQYAAESKSQLIATVNNMKFLLGDLLRPDEAWFMKKGKDGASTLVSQVF